MLRSWYLIDHHGRRRIGRTMADDRMSSSSNGASGPPSFSLLATRADPETVHRALEEVARTLSARFVACPALDIQEGALVVARIEGMTYVGEPGVDPSERFLAPDTVEANFGLLARDGLFY